MRNQFISSQEEVEALKKQLIVSTTMKPPVSEIKSELYANFSEMIPLKYLMKE